MTFYRGFKTGVVTNTYWATSEEDAELWLKPLLALEISDVTISDDALHHGEAEESPAKRALAAAKKLGMSMGAICIEKPTVETPADDEREKGAPVLPCAETGIRAGIVLQI